MHCVIWAFSPGANKVFSHRARCEDWKLEVNSSMPEVAAEGERVSRGTTVGGGATNFPST